MKSAKNWGKPVQESASQEYSINTAEKDVAKAINLGTSFRRLRPKLKPNTPYVVSFNDACHEDSSLFSAGVADTEVSIWNLNDVNREVTRYFWKKGYIHGCFTGATIILFCQFVMYIIGECYAR